MKIQIAVLIAFLFTVSLVSALGVSAPYWDGNPMHVDKGEKTTVELNLQNMVGNEDATLSAEIIQGSDIASLDKTEHTIQSGTSDYIVPLEISIPRDATGTKKVEIEFKTVTPGQEGSVTMGTGMTVAFDVVISDKITSSPNMTWYIVAVVLIALAGGIVFYFHRKKNIQ